LPEIRLTVVAQFVDLTELFAESLRQSSWATTGSVRIGGVPGRGQAYERCQFLFFCFFGWTDGRPFREWALEMITDYVLRPPLTVQKNRSFWRQNEFPAPAADWRARY